ncbi:MAG: SLATT domain-containing protein [Gammaproteobacteria bacterium]|nr:SLATT domain-containing protein [Gammaproteobacteria bacterium]MDH5800671.1 SLATT domain-containing protein [Gammaproteobacteria bacterium]
MFWTTKPTPESYLDEIDKLHIKKPVTLEQLDSIYHNTVQRALTDMHWYQKRQRRWRTGSRLIRGVVFLMLLVGAVIPLLQPDKAQNGYIALVIAGLSFSLDKIFLVSQTWVRYMSAEMAIKTLILEFRYDFLITRAGLDDNRADSLSETILAGFKTFLLKVHQVVTDETNAWSMQLDTALKMLGDTMKKQTELSEQKMKTLEQMEPKLSVTPSKGKSNERKKSSPAKLLDTIDHN